MKLKLIRDVLAAEETLGKLYIDDKFFCYTLEDVVRDKKIFAETCIPYGTYTVIVNHSDHFGKDLALIYNTSKDLSITAKNGDKWSGVRMHGGNTELDTEGCILVASTRHLNENSSWYDKAKHMIKNWIQGSMADKLTTLLQGKTSTLEIVKA